jgi:hypothetical protein
LKKYLHLSKPQVDLEIGVHSHLPSRDKLSEYKQKEASGKKDFESTLVKKHNQNHKVDEEARICQKIWNEHCKASLYQEHLIYIVCTRSRDPSNYYFII